MNTDIYSKTIWCTQTDSRSSGVSTAFGAPAGDLESNAILKAFIDDDDIQEIQIISFNIGFVHTYRKLWKKRRNHTVEEEALRLAGLMHRLNPDDEPDKQKGTPGAGE